MNNGVHLHSSPRRTKIVATIGPASSGQERLRQLLQAGVDVVRLNFSHGSYEEHLGVIHTARRLAREMGRPLAVLQDLQGPRLRVNGIAGGGMALQEGDTLVLTTRPKAGGPGAVSVTYPDLPRDVRHGDQVLLDDGRIRLRVTSANGKAVRCRVETGGRLASGKGMNLPGAELRTPSLTEKDLRDLEFGARHGVDYIALSFVSGPEDARAVRAALARHGSKAPVIAKIERARAVQAIDDILRAFDGVMIARGDLGVEIGPERVPLLQKRIIQRANALFKPVITATQMLESMVASPTPTRAEASDVANAVLDGTDAVMLSAETSVGGYPVEAVRIMDRIAAEADGIPGESRLERAAALDPARSVVRAAVGLAGETEARAIVIFTSSGRTAMLMSKHRPAMPIFACTRSAEVCHRLALWRGVVPVQTPLALHTDEMIAYAERLLLERGAAHPRDRVVMVGSAPMTARGRTNFIKVHTVQRPDRRVLGNLGL